MVLLNNKCLFDRYYWMVIWWYCSWAEWISLKCICDVLGDVAAAGTYNLFRSLFVNAYTYIPLSIINYYTIYLFIQNIIWSSSRFFVFPNLLRHSPFQETYLYLHRSSHSFQLSIAVAFYFQAFSFGTGIWCLREIHVLEICVEHFG